MSLGLPNVINLLSDAGLTVVRWSYAEAAYSAHMKVTARVMNGDTHDVELPEGATYARLLDEIGENPEAAVVVVDGRPVPEDAKVDADEVEVMRTVSGGSVHHR